MGQASGLNPPLPDVCWAAAFSYVPTPDLALAVPLTSRHFRDVCDRHDRDLWEVRCRDLWRYKVPGAYRRYEDGSGSCRGMTHRGRYLASVADAARTALTEEELCGMAWAFRFKGAAGEFWFDIDPYWQSGGRDYMVRRFRPDGTVANPGPPDILDTYVRRSNFDLRWRLTKWRRCGNRVLSGRYLNVNSSLEENEYPSSVIERNREDWGWIMQNQWVAYVSPPPSIKRMHEELEADVERFL